jgi:hypothetical protein
MLRKTGDREGSFSRMSEVPGRYWKKRLPNGGFVQDSQFAAEMTTCRTPNPNSQGTICFGRYVVKYIRVKHSSQGEYRFNGRRDLNGDPMNQTTRRLWWLTGRCCTTISLWNFDRRGAKAMLRLARPIDRKPSTKSWSFLFTEPSDSNFRL